MTSREELFVKEGVSPETAKLAAEATYLSPKERTPEQREAVSQVDKKIAENNRKLAD